MSPPGLPFCALFVLLNLPGQREDPCMHQHQHWIAADCTSQFFFSILWSLQHWGHLDFKGKKQNLKESPQNFSKHPQIFHLGCKVTGAWCGDGEHGRESRGGAERYRVPPVVQEVHDGVSFGPAHPLRVQTVFWLEKPESISEQICWANVWDVWL